jgi:predicted RNA-binding protein with PIN domain
MRWFIDGYNVIRRDPDLRAREAESLEAGRRALQHLLARARRDPRDEFTVVFDGSGIRGGMQPDGRIRVIFSRPPLTADDELARLARHWKSGAVVVSSDRTVQDAARRAGCAALTAEQFLEGLRTEPRPSSPGPPSDKADLEAPATKKGNPRRLSKKARRARRALRRLRES